MQLSKILKISDQLILTFWSFALTFVFSNIFSTEDFVVFSIYYTTQSIALLIINSTYGQMLLLEGRKYDLKSIVQKNLLISLFLFVVFILIFCFKVISLSFSDIKEYLLFSLSLSLFVCFEIFRRYLYSINRYTEALIAVIISLIPLFGGMCYFFIVNELHFLQYLYLNTVSFIIGIVYVLTIIFLRNPSTASDKLTFLKVFDFSKWLILGISAYIFSNRLFLFYLNEVGRHEELITYRLIETIFGIVLVFVAAFENYFISSIKASSLKSVIKSTRKIWALLCLILVLLAPFYNSILKIFFNHQTELSLILLIYILVGYEISVISRVLVIYLRLNKFNKTIFYSNLVSSAIVIAFFLFKVEITLENIFLLKVIFPITNILIYLIPYYKNEKNINYARFWSR